MPLFIISTRVRVKIDCMYFACEKSFRNEIYFHFSIQYSLRKNFFDAGNQFEENF